MIYIIILYYILYISAINAEFVLSTKDSEMFLAFYRSILNLGDNLIARIPRTLY